MQFLRDYSVWTLLALLAYYNLEKRQELQAYEADAFVILDDLESRIQKLDPNNRLLVGTYHEAKDTAVVSDTGSDATSSSSSSSSSDEQPKSPSSTPPPSNGSGGAVFF
ncbi:hypothetical protein GGI12_002772 [Dipsacomyces acuminosporus]|nr:hypothetical protein GGI12_002772 [Dipsacomyces acuminosporus]